MGCSFMLNELYMIERGLRAAGVAVAAHDPGISLLSKSERPLRVRLAKDGKVDSVELIDAALVLKLWTQRDGNHNSFPLVKTNGGMLQSAQLFEQWDDMPPGERRKLFAGVRWSEATRANGIRYHITVADAVSRYHIL